MRGRDLRKSARCSRSPDCWMSIIGWFCPPWTTILIAGSSNSHFWIWFSNQMLFWPLRFSSSGRAGSCSGTQRNGWGFSLAASVGGFSKSSGLARSSESSRALIGAKRFAFSLIGAPFSPYSTCAATGAASGAASASSFSIETRRGSSPDISGSVRIAYASRTGDTRMSKRWYSAVHAGGVACVAGALSTGTRKRLDVRTATSGPNS